MKILMCSFGSHGDVNPYLALGRELLQRGHAVTIATSSGYRDLIERHGLCFAPVRPENRMEDVDLMKRVMDARHGTETVVRQIVMPAIRDTYQDLLAPASKADVLVSHVLTYAVPILAEKTGQPWASTVLSPMVFFSPHEPPVLAPLPGLAKLRCLGPGINGWLFRQLKRISRSWSQPVADLRRELGLPSGLDPLWEGQHSPHLVLAMFSPLFGPPQPDWPANVEVTGFPFLDHSDTPLNAELEQFVAGKERPIVFTLGSAAVKVAGEFYRIAARVAKKLNRRAVLVAGSAADALKPELPASMTAVEWASFPGLFARAAVVVHSGGVGTTAQALRAGVPQLVVPFAHDQFDNADRVRRMGTGRILFRSRITEKSLSRELERVLADNGAMRSSNEIGRVISDERGAAKAAEILLNRWS